MRTINESNDEWNEQCTMNNERFVKEELTNEEEERNAMQ